MTFSLVARCPDTGMTGIVIASSSPAVAARCAHVRAGVGTVASQNITDPALGALILDAMAAGDDAATAVARVMEGRAHAAFRQIVAVDAAGRTAIRSGAEVLGLWGAAQGRDCAAAGNLLAHDGVPAAMVAGFLAAPGGLPDRLVAALAAGLAAGGEAGPVRSAGLKVAHRLSWPIVDLRVDWDDAPVARLAEVWAVYRPQVQAYADRATDPTRAPSFGVPGDP
jgi:uncharacterized Ntn-hydrolase superfamily protein